MKYEEECSICLEKLTEHINQIVLPCKHVFHGTCLLQHATKSQNAVLCPICRHHIIDIPTGSQQQQQQQQQQPQQEERVIIMHRVRPAEQIFIACSLGIFGLYLLASNMCS